MKILVLGASGSGKSAYAEQLVMKIAGEHTHYYIATMEACTTEAEKRVQRHRALRHGKGFLTIEQPRDVGKLAEKINERGSKDTVVLLECMSNLLANEMFQCKQRMERESIEYKILNDIEMLNNVCKDLVIVSNDIFEDGTIYEAETRKYQEILGTLNCQLTKGSDKVVEIVYGIPVVIKGGTII